jgi:hypothetical protein
MKQLAQFEKEIGGDGAKASGALQVDGSSIVAEVKVSFPLAKVIEPAMKVVDGLVDKLEKLIPGDQSGLAADLKREAREELVKVLSA